MYRAWSDIRAEPKTIYVQSLSDYSIYVLPMMIVLYIGIKHSYVHSFKSSACCFIKINTLAALRALGAGARPKQTKRPKRPNTNEQPCPLRLSTVKHMLATPVPTKSRQKNPHFEFTNRKSDHADSHPFLSTLNSRKKRKRGQNWNQPTLQKRAVCIPWLRCPGPRCSPSAAPFFCERTLWIWKTCGFGNAKPQKPPELQEDPRGSERSGKRCVFKQKGV